MKKQRSQEQQKSSSMGPSVSGQKSQTPPETSTRSPPGSQRETTPTRKLVPGTTPRGGTATLSSKRTFWFFYIFYFVERVEQCLKTSIVPRVRTRGTFFLYLDSFSPISLLKNNSRHTDAPAPGFSTNRPRSCKAPRNNNERKSSEGFGTA